MIIVCPQCQTRYLVADAALEPDGRRVRCANCRHSWFQTMQEDGGAPLPPPPPRAPVTDGPALPKAGVADDRPDAFVHAPPFRPRRNPLTMWTWIAAGVAIVATAAIVALLAFGGPGGLSIAGTASPVIITASPDVKKQTMPNGGELLAYAGRLANQTASVQRVPDIRAELRDSGGRVVYSWTIPAPVARLRPGETYAFNGSELDVPKSAAEIHFAAADAR